MSTTTNLKRPTAGHSWFDACPGTRHEYAQSQNITGEDSQPGTQEPLVE